MVLMKTLWSTTDSAVAELHEESMIRLLNVLRKCRACGHTELVLGVCGSLNHASLEEISKISELLHDALLDSSDVAKSFAKVSFTVQLHEDKLKALRENMQ